MRDHNAGLLRDNIVHQLRNHTTNLQMFQEEMHAIHLLSCSIVDQEKFFCLPHPARTVQHEKLGKASEKGFFKSSKNVKTEAQLQFLLCTESINI